MKKVIFLGKTGCGKTTLCQAIHNLNFEYKKTQAIEIYDNAIDTPGEYIENRAFLKALIVTSVDADVIAIVKDATEEENYIPPAFAQAFSKEVIGIITKSDLAKEEDIKRARETLLESGTEKIFIVSTIEDKGLLELFNYLK